MEKITTELIMNRIVDETSRPTSIIIKTKKLCCMHDGEKSCLIQSYVILFYVLFIAFIQSSLL